MRILLIGDFSSFHYNLKIGLEKLGCEVVLFSNQDGWKNIPVDIQLGSGINTLGGRLLDQFWIKDFFNLKKSGKFDIVQFMNPVIYPFNLAYKIGSTFPNKAFIKMAVDQSEKSFLISGAIDYLYTSECLNGGFRYEPISDCIKIDKGPLINQFFRYDWQSTIMKDLNYWLIDLVDEVIPIVYEGKVSYKNQGVKNIGHVIPQPLDTSNIAVSKPNSYGSLITHGLNKPGFKGFKYIKSAFDKLKLENDNYNFTIQGSLALEEYLMSLKQTTVVVDQVQSYSYAMNALYSLASGKVVISGAEHKALKALKTPKVDFLINAWPDTSSIIHAINMAIACVEDIPDYHDQCRDYVDTYHRCDKIAQQYLERWAAA